MVETGTAVFELQALYGPPRPVLVLRVSGEVDRSNDTALIDAVHRAAALARTAPGLLPRSDFGCRTLARAVVVDLRAVTFLGARALGRLAFQRDAAGERVRIVVPRDSVIRRALAVVDHFPDDRLHADLAGAVLGQPDPTERVSD